MCTQEADAGEYNMRRLEWRWILWGNGHVNCEKYVQNLDNISLK